MGQSTPRDSALPTARLVGEQKDQPLQCDVQVNVKTAVGLDTANKWEVNPRY